MKFNARVFPAQKPLGKGEYSVSVANERVALGAGDEGKVDKYWEAAKLEFPALTNGRLLNVEGYLPGPFGTALLERDKLVDYSMFIAKRNEDLQPRSAGLSKDAESKIRPRGMSAVTLTSDGFILFGNRPHNVFAPNQLTNIPEGMANPACPDPFDFILRSLPMRRS